MRLTLGINTCFAVKRWPRVVDWAPVVRDRLDLRVVQHSFDLADPLVDDSGRLRADIRDHHLELHSTFTGLAAYSSNMLLDPDPDRRRAAAAWYSRSIAFTAEAGGIATGGHIGAFSVPDWADPVRRAERWTALATALGAAAEEAHRAGLGYLVVENLAAEREPSTMAMLRDLLTEGDASHVPVRLCLDVGHMCVPGTSGDDRDPYAWLRTMGPLAPIIQLQQSDAEGDHHWPFTARFNRVGRIDADRVIDALGEGGVDTTVLILEVIPPFEQEDGSVVDDLAESVDYWRAAIARRGVEAD
jgi:sugar phosphate isomerase/epimerase